MDGASVPPKPIAVPQELKLKQYSAYIKKMVMWIAQPIMMRGDTQIRFAEMTMIGNVRQKTQLIQAQIILRLVKGRLI